MGDRITFNFPLNPIEIKRNKWSKTHLSSRSLAISLSLTPIRSRTLCHRWCCSSPIFNSLLLYSLFCRSFLAFRCGVLRPFVLLSGFLRELAASIFTKSVKIFRTNRRVSFVRYSSDRWLDLCEMNIVFDMRMLRSVVCVVNDQQRIM